MIHLYGVVRGLTELPPVAGLEGAPLERRRIDGLDVVFSHAETGGADGSDETVLVHARVIEELMERGEAILPARFGRAFRNDEELVSAVQARAPELERSLNRVRGCVEFGLRLFSVEPENGDERVRSGREYMRLRLAEANERDRLADELHEPLARLARATTRSAGASSVALSAAYLVPDENVDTFRERAQRLIEANGELAAVCTGPWPPYSFAANEEQSL